MRRLITTIRRLAASEEGVSAMEYALLGALIAVVIIVAVSSVGTETKALFSYVAAQVAAAMTTAGL